jgi:hypothetical protein
MPQKHDKGWQKRHARELAAVTSTTSNSNRPTQKEESK